MFEISFWSNLQVKKTDINKETSRMKKETSSGHVYVKSWGTVEHVEKVSRALVIRRALLFKKLLKKWKDLGCFFGVVEEK